MSESSRGKERFHEINSTTVWWIRICYYLEFEQLVSSNPERERKVKGFFTSFHVMDIEQEEESIIYRKMITATSFNSTTLSHSQLEGCQHYSKL